MNIKTAFAIIVAIMLSMITIQKEIVKNDLINEWTMRSGTVTKRLSIRENEIKYRLETTYSWMNRTVSTREWEMITPSMISINWYGGQVYEIAFNEDKTMLRITPAYTTEEASEDWYLDK